MATDLIIGFLTLTALEIVLGIDNLVFISILSNKLPPETHREWGRVLAMDPEVVAAVTEKWARLGLPPMGA